MQRRYRGCPTYGTVYLVQDRDRIEQVVIPVEGVGMWGTLYGFIAIDRDGNTIRGLTYYDQKETPGLGGEAGNPKPGRRTGAGARSTTKTGSRGSP